MKNIRNFCIIAHIDHGKSTFADRLIQKCGGLTEREMTTQVLDSMDLEKERGITIKAQTVRLNYKSKKDDKNYVLNIIDTPGHVDFSYEVNRSLASCEGSLLIVDSTQGVEAQTLANVYQAMDNHHEIITVLNKIDLPASDVERVKKQIEDVIGIDTSDALSASGKTGEGVEEYRAAEKSLRNRIRDAKRRFEKRIAKGGEDSISKRKFYSYVKNKTKTRTASGHLRATLVRWSGRRRTWQSS